VNRSRRRTAVVNWAITAGVLFGAVGIVGVVPAAASPAGAGETPGAGDGSSGSDRHSNVVGGGPEVRQIGPGTATDRPSPRRGYPGRATARVPTGSVSVETAKTVEPDDTDDMHEWDGHGHGHWHWHWHCHIILPTGVPLPPGTGGANNSIIGLVDLSLSQLPPVVPFSSVAAPRLPGFTAESLGGPAGPGAGLGQTPPAPQGEPDRATAPAAPPSAAPLAGGNNPPAAPVPQRPGTGAPPPDGRLGYPAYLRNADFAQVAAIALSGLAGFVAITAVGGFLGYRQAKAGYVLPPAATARFLQ
jgi:hypothetical protein